MKIESAEANLTGALARNKAQHIRVDRHAVTALLPNLGGLKKARNENHDLTNQIKGLKDEIETLKAQLSEKDVKAALDIQTWADRVRRLEEKTSSILVVRQKSGKPLPEGAQPVYLVFNFVDTQSVAVDPLEFGEDGMGVTLDHLAHKHGGIASVSPHIGPIAANMVAAES